MAANEHNRINKQLVMPERSQKRHTGIGPKMLRSCHQKPPQSPLGRAASEDGLGGDFAFISRFSIAADAKGRIQSGRRAVAG